MASVTLRGVSRHYPGVAALDDVSLTIEAGEFFTPGCGKTTLLRTIAGFNRQDSGEILFDATRVDGMPIAVYAVFRVSGRNEGAFV